MRIIRRTPRVALFMLLTFVTSSVATVAIAQQHAFPPATPESQGLSTDALTALSDHVRGFIEKDQAVGAELLVIKNRRTVWHETFGVSDREREIAWAPNTVCNIRSMSKPITAAAAQILIDRGELELDAPVAKYLDAFDTDASREITVRQVLTHRSGLPLTVITERIDQYESLQAQAAAAGAGGPEFEPDSKFWYSDAGTDVVGAIVEKISGVTLDAFVKTEILEPLGMHDTGYILADDDPLLARCASLYFGRPDAWTRFWNPEADGPMYPFAWGSQTIYGTPMDYAKFLALWMDRGKVGDTQLLSEDAIVRTLTPVSRMKVLGSDQPFPTDYRRVEPHYGQMALVYMPERDGDDKSDNNNAAPAIIGHSGSDGTVGLAWPERDLMVLYFTQSRGGASVLRLEQPIDTLILHPDEPLADAEVPEQYQKYLGTYIANFGAFDNEEFEVRMHNGRLALDIPSQLTFELQDPDDEGRWYFALTNEVSISFEEDETGEIDHIKIYQSGMAFEIPRQGSAKAAAMAAEAANVVTTVDPETVAPFLGIYEDEQSGGRIQVFLEGDTLHVREVGGDGPFDLLPTAGDDDARFNLKQLPGLTLTFNANDDGQIVSLTRAMGDRTWLMNRVEEEEGEEGEDPEP